MIGADDTGSDYCIILGCRDEVGSLRDAGVGIQGPGYGTEKMGSVVEGETAIVGGFSGQKV